MSPEDVLKIINNRRSFENINECNFQLGILSDDGQAPLAVKTSLCAEIAALEFGVEYVSRITIALSGLSVYDDVIVSPVTGPFPLTKASDAELWCFLWSAPEQTVEEPIETLVIWDAIALIMTSL